MNTEIKSIFIIIAFLSISCNEGPCDGIVCQNNGTCINGVCDCPSGYEGLLCSEITSQKVTGNFNVTYNCSNSTGETDDWGILLNANDNGTVTEITIMQFHKPGLSVDATITGPNAIELQELINGPGGYSVSGTGTIEANGWLSFEYTFISTFTSDTTMCSVQAIRK